jgi:AcrR family transcriptional regulator
VELSNPSLYYHFRSKGEILAELLAEPLKRVEIAVSEADQLTGDERAKRIIGGLLDALEVHSGVAITGFRGLDALPEPYRDLPRAMQPMIENLLGEYAAEDNRALRIAMAIAAVDGAVSDLMLNSPDGIAFVEKLRANRNVIIDLVLKILR